jgi:hypothetical protein
MQFLSSALLGLNGRAEAHVSTLYLDMPRPTVGFYCELVETGIVAAPEKNGEENGKS